MSRVNKGCGRCSPAQLVQSVGVVTLHPIKTGPCLYKVRTHFSLVFVGHHPGADRFVRQLCHIVEVVVVVADMIEVVRQVVVVVHDRVHLRRLVAVKICAEQSAVF